MNQKKLFGNFLRDPKTGFLWLHTYTYDKEFIVNTYLGKIDLATCEHVYAEIVSAKFYIIFGPSVQVIVARDEKGNYAVFSLFMDSLGFGGVYASITPGFTFKSLYCFNEDADIYIIGEDVDQKWGIIRISLAETLPESPWRISGAYSPNVIASFRYDSMQEALELCQIAKSYADLGNLTDLTKPSEEMTDFYDEKIWGTPLSVIQECRGIRPKPSHLLKRKIFKKKPIVAPSQPRGIVLDKNNKDEAKGRGLRVTLCGKVFEEGDAVEVYKEVLEDIGLGKVHETDLNVKGFKIVDSKPRTGFRWKCQDQIGKYWVYTKIGNPKKVDFLLKLKERFNLDMIIEAVD